MILSIFNILNNIILKVFKIQIKEYFTYTFNIILYKCEFFQKNIRENNIYLIILMMINTRNTLLYLELLTTQPQSTIFLYPK